MNGNPLIHNDAIVFGILMILLAFVFYTSSIENKFWKKFYSVVPTILVCYFLPSIFNSLGIISGKVSNLYFVASRYLLPASLVLLTLSVDLKEILKLGPKALIMFLAGTFGILVGGPLSIILFSFINPDLVGGAAPNEVWRGMTTIAGSWIGGGANQAAMKEVFQVSGDLFSKMVTVDILVGNSWLAVLLLGVGRNKMIDRYLKADASSIDAVKTKIEDYQRSITKIPKVPDIILILGVAFAATGFSHFVGDFMGPFILTNLPGLERYSLTSTFFWIVVVATAIGVTLSFTKARKLEGVGSSKIGSVFIYILIATIGMQMDVTAIFSSPGIFLVGIVWILFHVMILFIVAKIIRAPYFFVAVGSQANVGGAASAPVVASAFHPSLAPVGVLLAVLGYAVGTYAAYICGLLMQFVSP